ncbi:cobalt ECF transporter T component CbiQ [Modestobacter sp. I12A-02628]|uniref:Cobalt ECF transporter T component CbiQ n=1 Tax=Goekera deserti TaxID=2497753 RepID=A0A7K3WH22_9ACTN|nr:cobalt ECF transporter T component CbiQ [Goekera deserti]MPQ97279.1 cobalt ECF transporter T component CbiQ [Goekera deserti]NDI50210.1 cobalt ECF transporter T component CbiQ [Goekera deserti]NEL55778.1 cobalt ECF transporter T component CbiQ [Goekera deserti]
MGAGHSAGGISAAYVAGDSPVHRLEPHTKLVAVVAFALVVVTTPVQAASAPVAYAGFLALVLGVAAVAGVRAARLARSLLVELPFVFFALLLPVVSGGPRVQVLGLSLSEHGLWTGGGLLAKATLSVLAATVLAATTEPRALLRGLQRLHLPQVLVQILMFMVRYADVVLGELRRMRVARESRGFRPRHVGALRVLGPAAGSLFIRSYERGERVHLAMLSRGFTGRLPTGPPPVVGARSWATALTLPLAAAVVLGTSSLLL